MSLIAGGKPAVYVVKDGNLYLAGHGVWSDKQRDAVRLARGDARNVVDGSLMGAPAPRVVRLVPRRENAVQNDGDVSNPEPGKATP